MTNQRSIAVFFIVGTCFIVAAMILTLAHLDTLSVAAVGIGFLLFLCWAALDARISK